MNYPEGFMEEMVKKQRFVEKWGSFLDNDTEWDKRDLSLILENQSIEKQPKLNTVKQTWNKLAIRDLASAQPLFSNNGYFYYLDDKYTMKKGMVNLTPQAYKTRCSLARDVAEIVATEIDRRCIAGIMRGAATNCELDLSSADFADTYERLTDLILGLAMRIDFKAKHGPATWIVTSPEICSILASSSSFVVNKSHRVQSIHRLGNIRIGNLEFKIYEDPFFTTNRLLLGCKGNHPYDSGFFLCIYTLLAEANTNFLFGTSGGYLSPNGNSFYGNILINNALF